MRRARSLPCRRGERHLQEIALGGLILFTVLVIPGGAVSLLKRCRPGWKEPLRRTEHDG